MCKKLKVLQVHLRDQIISNLVTHLEKLERGLRKCTSDSASLSSKISMVRMKTDDCKI